jgi:hypothetical protein
MSKKNKHYEDQITERYSKCHHEAAFTIDQYAKNFRPKVITVEGKKFIYKHQTDSAIYFKCIFARRAFKCPGSFRILKQAKNGEIITEHSEICSNPQIQEKSNFKSLEPNIPALSEKKNKQEQQPKPMNDQIHESLDDIIQVHPEYTPAKVLEELKKLYGEETKLPVKTSIKKRLTRTRKIMGLSSLDLFFKNNTTKDNYTFFRCYHQETRLLKGKEEDLKFAIWMSGFQMTKLREAKHFYVDATFKVVPKGFSQLLVIFIRDNVTNCAFPGAFILMNKKNSLLYEIALRSFRDLIIEYGRVKIQMETATCDFESGLIKSFRQIFNPIRIVGCLYHFKNLLWKRARKERLQISKWIVITEKFIANFGRLSYLSQNEIDDNFKNLVDELIDSLASMKEGDENHEEEDEEEEDEKEEDEKEEDENINENNEEENTEESKVNKSSIEESFDKIKIPGFKRYVKYCYKNFLPLFKTGLINYLKLEPLYKSNSILEGYFGRLKQTLRGQNYKSDLMGFINMLKEEEKNGKSSVRDAENRAETKSKQKMRTTKFLPPDVKNIMDKLNISIKKESNQKPPEMIEGYILVHPQFEMPLFDPDCFVEDDESTLALQNNTDLPLVIPNSELKISNIAAINTLHQVSAAHEKNASIVKPSNLAFFHFYINYPDDEEESGRLTVKKYIQTGKAAKGKIYGY